MPRMGATNQLNQKLKLGKDKAIWRSLPLEWEYGPPNMTEKRYLRWGGPLGSNRAFRLSKGPRPEQRIIDGKKWRLVGLTEWSEPATFSKNYQSDTRLVNQSKARSLALHLRAVGYNARVINWKNQSGVYILPKAGIERKESKGQKKIEGPFMESIFAEDWKGNTPDDYSNKPLPYGISSPDVTRNRRATMIERPVLFNREWKDLITADEYNSLVDGQFHQRDAPDIEGAQLELIENYPIANLDYDIGVDPFEWDLFWGESFIEGVKSGEAPPLLIDNRRGERPVLLDGGGRLRAIREAGLSEYPAYIISSDNDWPLTITYDDGNTFVLTGLTKEDGQVRGVYQVEGVDADTMRTMADTEIEMDLDNLRSYYKRMVDCRGQKCPYPILNAKQALSQMSSGEQLTLVATDWESEYDIPQFALRYGHSLDAMQKDPSTGEITFILTKG